MPTVSNGNRKPNSRRKPIKTIEEFDKQHKDMRAKIADYLHLERKGSQRLDEDQCDEVFGEGHIFLESNNFHARMKFVKIAVNHLAPLFQSFDAEFPIGFLTFAPLKFAVSETDTANFDIAAILTWTKKLLKARNYVAMVEAALYTNLGDHVGSTERVVSFHVHVVIWGTAELELKQMRDDINDRYGSIVPGIKPADYRMIDAKEAIGQLIYMCKAPLSEHRIYPRRKEIIDRQTGEVTKVATGRFKQKKRELRSGDAVRMCRIMGGFELDTLFFAGGKGREFSNAIKHDALAQYRLWRARRDHEKYCRENGRWLRYEQTGNGRR